MSNVIFYAQKPDGQGVRILELAAVTEVVAAHQPAGMRFKITFTTCNNNPLLWACCSLKVRGQLTGLEDWEPRLCELQEVHFHADGYQRAVFHEVADGDE